MACGFIGEVQHHGVMVQPDVSVMGFDDIELVSHMTPALSTIRQPLEALGRNAASAAAARPDRRGRQERRLDPAGRKTGAGRQHHAAGQLSAYIKLSFYFNLIIQQY